MLNMTMALNDTFVANIPAQVAGTTIWYYIQANSISGRTVSKPLVAPGGVYEFNILGTIGGLANVENTAEFFEPYPNPANESVTLGYYLSANENVLIQLFDIRGKGIFALDEKNINAGTHTFQLSTAALSAGIYSISFKSGNTTIIRKLVVAK